METNQQPTTHRRRRRRLVGLLFVAGAAATIGAASFSLAIIAARYIMLRACSS